MREAGGVEREGAGGPVAVDYRLYSAPRFVITMATNGCVAQHTICTEHFHHRHHDQHCHCHHHDHHDPTCSELEEVVVGAVWSGPNTGLRGNMGTMET